MMFLILRNPDFKGIKSFLMETSFEKVSANKFTATVGVAVNLFAETSKTSKRSFSL